MSVTDEHKIMRRVAGFHDIRLDGVSDIVSRARGATVLDLGCNRGLAGFECANNGAVRVYGCDTYVKGLAAAQEIFADLRNCASRFEYCDLAKAPDSFKAAFGHEAELKHDIVMLLATLHKLKRQMSREQTGAMLRYFGDRCGTYFVWRATSDKPSENNEEMAWVDRELGTCGLSRIHTSLISEQLGLAAIWRRSA